MPIPRRSVRHDECPFRNRLLFFLACQPSQQDLDASEKEPCPGRGDSRFEVPGQPPVSAQPCQRPLHRPASKPSGPPLSVVFADRLSTMPADGPVARPPDARDASAGRWLIDTHRPLSRHAAKYRYTVRHGGKPFGDMRHGQPQRRTDKIAFTTSRRSVRRRRPGGLRGGIADAISPHSASSRSLAWHRPSRAYCGRVVSGHMSRLTGSAGTTSESQPIEITQLISKRIFRNLPRHRTLEVWRTTLEAPIRTALCC